MLVVYVILLAISVLFYIMYVGSFSFYLMVFLFSMPVILFALNVYISRKLKISFVQPMHKAVGRSAVVLEILVENPTIFPVANLEIFIEHQSAIESKNKNNITKINLPLISKESQSLKLNIASIHLGKIDLKIKKCRIYDFLRLFKFKVRGKAFEDALRETILFVYPQYSLMENTVSDYSGYGIESDEYSPDKKGDDPSQIFGLHEYIEGDKPNRIHWKLTAKQDQVMVKEYSHMMTYAVNIFVNLNTGSAKEYDAVIEGALSVSMMLTDRGIAHSMMWFDKASKSIISLNIKDEDDHYECADLLIRSKTYIDAEARIYPFTSQSEQICCGHLIVFSSKLDEKDIDSISTSGYSARYLFAFAKTDDEPQTDITTQENVGIIYIRKDHISEAFSDIVF